MFAQTNSFAKVAALVAVTVFAVAAFAVVAPAARAALTMNLTVGSTGAEVTELQTWLIGKGYSIPAGATGYFGAQTQAAVAAYQAAKGITPAVGYFGPITRAAVAADGGSTMDDDDSSSDTGDLSGGESSLEDLNANSGDDDQVDEGGSAQVAEFEFDVEDGDIRIERLDLTFDAETSPANGETEPWETFETITILNADGDELASEDVTDEDEWLDEDDPQVFRFTGLDYVVEENDTGKLIVEVEAQNGTDITASTGDSWTVYIDEDGLRGLDGEGLDQYLGDATETVEFDVENEGDGEELNLSSSSEDPDSSVIEVMDDETSDWHTIFAFELDAEGADIDLDMMEIVLGSTDPQNTRDVVNDAMLVIDGEEFDDFDWSTEGSASSTLFDIDKEFTIGEDESVTVEYQVEFKAQDGNYAAGTTISASTTGSLITGEGADDLVADGSATGDVHTLQVSGINVEPVDDSAAATVVDGVDNDYATYEIEVEVTAFDSDIYIHQTATQAFFFRFENASDASTFATSSVTNASSTTMTVSSSADTTGNKYRVNEGDTETFTFGTTLNPGQAYEGISYRMQLLSIAFGTSSAWGNGSSAATSTYSATPESDYETNGVLIND